MSSNTSHRPLDLISRDMTAIIARIQGEFLEMPGLRLAPAQAARLWALDSRTCDWVLKALVDAGFLWQTREGMYLRATAS